LLRPCDGLRQPPPPSSPLHAPPVHPQRDLAPRSPSSAVELTALLEGYGTEVVVRSAYVPDSTDTTLVKLCNGDSDDAASGVFDLVRRRCAVPPTTMGSREHSGSDVCVCVRACVCASVHARPVWLRLSVSPPHHQRRPSRPPLT
jgi:hypothetical protein